MALPPIVPRSQWLAERRALLEREKELTRARDRVNADRRRLPMVRVEKDYVFTGPDGPVSLRRLFGDSRQLIVHHVMFDPEWSAACPSCTATIDEKSGAVARQLRRRDTALALVSRAPFAKLETYRAERGWDLDWFSSFGSDFNYDFGVTLDPAVTPVVFNYRTEPELRRAGMDWVLEHGSLEQPGYSCFLRDGEELYHTYSTYGRGTDAFCVTYGFLDLTALGRQEAWEEPADRVEHPHAADPSFLS